MTKAESSKQKSQMRQNNTKIPPQRPVPENGGQDLEFGKERKCDPELPGL